jgi:phospholipid/cholesterol/gamma-HCH transport system substrate-binding protein
MQQYTKLEIAVGAFVVAGAAALVYLSVSLGGLSLFSSDRYEVFARFSSVGGLKHGDPVRVSGVLVGEVRAIRLNEFTAEAELSIDRAVKLPTDTIASIQSNGLLGDAYVSLSPGAEADTLAPGGRIARTEPAISLTELIAKYAFGSPIAESPDAPKAAPAGSNEAEKSPFDDPLQ